MKAIIGIGIFIIMSLLVSVVVELLSLKFKFMIVRNDTTKGILTGIAIILSVIVCLIFF